MVVLQQLDDDDKAMEKKRREIYLTRANRMKNWA